MANHTIVSPLNDASQENVAPYVDPLANVHSTAQEALAVHIDRSVRQTQSRSATNLMQCLDKYGNNLSVHIAIMPSPASDSFPSLKLKVRNGRTTSWLHFVPSVPLSSNTSSRTDTACTCTYAPRHCPARSSTVRGTLRTGRRSDSWSMRPHSP